MREFTSALEANLREMAIQVAIRCICCRALARSSRFTTRSGGRSRRPVSRNAYLHHAIMNVCEPEFERFLIDDTYACRRGKGRIAAVQTGALLFGTVSRRPEARCAKVL